MLSQIVGHVRIKKLALATTASIWFDWIKISLEVMQWERRGRFRRDELYRQAKVSQTCIALANPLKHFGELKVFSWSEGGGGRGGREMQIRTGWAQA